VEEARRREEKCELVTVSREDEGKKAYAGHDEGEKEKVRDGREGGNDHELASFRLHFRT